jgi:hypothetical protein
MRNYLKKRGKVDVEINYNINLRWVRDITLTDIISYLREVRDKLRFAHPDCVEFWVDPDYDIDYCTSGVIPLIGKRWETKKEYLKRIKKESSISFKNKKVIKGSKK